MEATLTILGSNSALPAQGRHPSAQVLQLHNESFLIDCGEGTQLQMSNFHVKRSRISTIFISHLHGDHIYGLPGLITSYNHYMRPTPLTIYGPTGLKKFIEYSVLITGNPLNFDLHIHEFDADTPQTLIDTDSLTVKTVPLIHRVPTAGYLFHFRYPQLKIRPGTFEKHNVPVEFRKGIQQGADFIKPDGEVIANEVFTEPIRPSLSYAYLSDTMYHPPLVDEVRHFQTIYHEATFLDALSEKAESTKHSTASQAARIAKDAEVGRLIIGHFSSRYHDLSKFLDEAKPVFQNTLLAIEGHEFKLST